MNRKSTMFAALQQDEEAEDHNADDGDNAMATEKIEQPESTVNAPASTVVSIQAGNNPAMDDEDEEIT